MKCPSCGAEVSAGAGRCRACYAPIEPAAGEPASPPDSAPVPRPGVLRRLLRRLGLPDVRIAFGPGRIETRVREIRTERIELTDPDTGERRVYGSLADVPEEHRHSIEEALRRGGGEAVRYERITVRGPDGDWRTYGSLDEAPPDVREALKRMKRERDGGE